ncbi:hypothetical protein D9M73_114150 [compost metagenome]
MQVKAIASLSREEIRDLAHAAADRGEHKEAANPFPVGSLARAHFEHDFLDRERALAPAG